MEAATGRNAEGCLRMLCLRTIGPRRAQHGLKELLAWLKGGEVARGY